MAYGADFSLRDLNWQKKMMYIDQLTLTIFNLKDSYLAKKSNSLPIICILFNYHFYFVFNFTTFVHYRAKRIFELEFH